MIAKDMIEASLEVMLGKPIIKETRIPVDLIVRTSSSSSVTRKVLPKDWKG